MMGLSSTDSQFSVTLAAAESWVWRWLKWKLESLLMGYWSWRACLKGVVSVVCG